MCYPFIFIIKLMNEFMIFALTDRPSRCYFSMFLRSDSFGIVMGTENGLAFII